MSTGSGFLVNRVIILQNIQHSYANVTECAKQPAASSYIGILAYLPRFRSKANGNNASIWRMQPVGIRRRRVYIVVELAYAKNAAYHEAVAAVVMTNNAYSVLCVCLSAKGTQQQQWRRYVRSGSLFEDTSKMEQKARIGIAWAVFHRVDIWVTPWHSSP